MARVRWGELPPFYDLGVDHGVLYLDEGALPWNGLVSVDERENGLINTDHYFDGNHLHISQELGDYEATISAFTYPDVFAEYNGYSDRRTYRRFGLSYRTQHGDNYFYHLVYNVLVKDDSRTWVTEKANAEPSTFSWNIHSSAIPIPGARPGSHLVMEAPQNSEILDLFLDVLYGTETSEPRLPDPVEVLELYEAATLLRVTYNSDGTYTVSGPDHMVKALPDGQFEIDAPSAYLLEQGRFLVHSH